MTFVVEIKNYQRRFRINRTAVRELIVYVLKKNGLNQGEVGVVFSNNRRIRELNREYLGRDHPTDVLAFPQNEGEAGRLHQWFLGDIVVSTERIAEQASEFGQPVEDELALCLIHGLLHLIGYLDSPAAKREEMRKVEEKLLRFWRKKEWSLIKL